MSVVPILAAAMMRRLLTQIQIVNDASYRDELTAKSRAAMEDHTYERQSWRWARAWGLEGK